MSRTCLHEMRIFAWVKFNDQSSRTAGEFTKNSALPVLRDNCAVVIFSFSVSDSESGGLARKTSYIYTYCTILFIRFVAF